MRYSRRQPTCDFHHPITTNIPYRALHLQRARIFHFNNLSYSSPHLSSHPHPILSHTTHPLLLTPTPHALQKPIPLRQPIKTVIGLPHRPHESTHSIRLVLASVSAILIDFADGELDRGVVLGFDDAVGGGAFAGDVAGMEISGCGSAAGG